MTSLSKKTKRRRKNRLRNQGKGKKRKLSTYGTTPPLSIDPKEETGEEKQRRDKMMSGR